jgi:hypothetical protein
VHAFREVEPVAWQEPQIRERGDRAQEEKSGGKRQAQAPEAAPRSEASRDMAGNGADESNPGTGWGDRQWDRVHRTQFEAMAKPSDRIAFRYEYASGLRALGIFPRTPRTWDRDRGLYGFAEPPRW